MQSKFFGLIIALFLVGIASGQDEQPQAEVKTDAAAEIDKLMQQLDANRFSERQAAQQKLTDFGKAAFPALEKGTQHVSREVAVRSLDVLKSQFQNGDEATKAAAKETLERLAKNNDAILAKRAGEILSPPKPAPQLPQGVPGGFGNAQIQIQVGGGGGGLLKRLIVRTINGVKEIEAEENGKKVKITDDPVNGIKMEVTERKDGKETTQKHEAKDAAELKTKHPEAHKLYEEYSKQPAGIQVQVGGFPGGAIPPGFPAIPALPRAPGGVRIPRMKILRPDEFQGIQDDFDAALKTLDSSLKELDAAVQTLKDVKPGSEELKKSQQQLETAKKQVQELKAKLAE
jgi:hypothetical protein